jgi:hypothetical protein
MKIGRREFIKGASGMVIVSSLPFITGCRGVKRDDFPMAHESEQMAKFLGKEEIEIFSLASLAPSGHNAQPWMVKVIEPGHWIIGTAKDRWLPAVDPENREVLLSLGAFIQNLEIAAGLYGYTLNLDVTANDNHEPHILDVRITKAKPVDFPVEKILKRRTVRKNMLREQIKPADIAYITSNDREHILYFPKGTQEARYLENGTIEANRVQAWRNPAQEELANWIRWSDAEARKYRNGLTPESMEIGGFSGWYVRHFFTQKSTLEKGFRQKTVQMVAEQVADCGGWLIVLSKDTRIPALIETGMRLERMLFQIRERMIAIHPMTQMLEETPSRTQMAKDLGISDTVQFILRIGYLKTYPNPVSLRMPISWFVQT